MQGRFHEHHRTAKSHVPGAPQPLGLEMIRLCLVLRLGFRALGTYASRLKASRDLRLVDSSCLP